MLLYVPRLMYWFRAREANDIRSGTASIMLSVSMIVSVSIAGEFG